MTFVLQPFPEWNNFGVGYCTCQCFWDGTWWPGDVGQPQCNYYLGWSQIRLLFCFRTKSCSSCQVVRVPTHPKSLQMWPHCGVLSQHPLFDVALEGRSISALVFFPLQRHLRACNDHTYVLRVSDSWAMQTRVMVGESLSFHIGNDGIMWFHVHGRHQAVAPIAACRKEFSIFNSFVVSFT